MLQLPRKLLQPILIRHFSSYKKKYVTADHEWVGHVNNNIFQMGLTKHAIDEMGEIVYAEFNVKENDIVKENDTIIDLESVKATSSINAPVNLTIQRFNSKVEDNVSALTDKDWLFEFMAEAADVENKLDE